MIPSWYSKILIVAKYYIRIKSCIEIHKTFSFGRFCLNNRNFMFSTQAMSGKHLNRLANEKSPYLLQHATNPVDWYPWGQEAFDKAKVEDKLIFLSVGYSTCHWCHVMERESFMDETIAAILNENFVSIKIDREERPDIDRVYMTFIQATSKSGGWPMSVWLTPDLKPIVGGTYFPPNDNYYGQPGFASTLKNIAKQWRTNRDNIMEQGTVILEALTQGIAVSAGTKLPGIECLDRCYTMLAKHYDDEYGGFSRQPKFPQPANFYFMFRFNHLKPTSTGGKQGLEMALHTLNCMAKGGICDHIGQGFHRYSTDAQWHVPHFEKMLYDQAQLVYSYIDAYQISKNEYYASIARGILSYITRDLTSPLGGFYSAEDADSLPFHDSLEKKEGAFYVWTEEEVNSLLGDVVEGVSHLHWTDIFKKHYGIEKLGNVDPQKDWHNEFKQQNILFIKNTEAETAKDLKLDANLVSNILEKCRLKLLHAREQRPYPHKDMKILTAWNGLMISGFARAGEVLQEPIYLEQATKALNFIRTHLYLQEQDLLLRSCYCDDEGTVSQIASPILGFAEDYACMIQALLDTYEASLDDRWLNWAKILQVKQDELFLDNDHGGYFTTTLDDKAVMLRLKEDQDGAEPSANSISANNLIRLANYFQNSEWENSAKKIMILFSERLTKIPIIMPQMLCALIPLYVPVKQIVIVGSKEAEDTKKLIQTVQSLYLPNKIIIVNDKSTLSILTTDQIHPLPETMVENKATAYVCNNYSCKSPVTSQKELYKQLCE